MLTRNRLISAAILTCLTLGVAVAQTPPPSGSPAPAPSAPAPSGEKVHVAPAKIDSAKPGLTARTQITVTGVMPQGVRGGYTFDSTTSFDQAKGELTIVLDPTAPKEAVFTRSSEPFKTVISVPALEGFKGKLNVIVTSTAGAELYRLYK